MNYELAKQLKDAGFPIAEKANKLSPERTYLTKDLEFAYSPTLSELIEACGDKIHGIHQAEDMYGETVWFATLKHDYRKFISNGPGREGKTPEEAVANLWLALNKKND